MFYRWMFEEVRALTPFRGAAEELAAYDDWGPLYDLDRLAANEVPVFAAVYFDDMYVDSGLQLETAGVRRERAGLGHQRARARRDPRRRPPRPRSADGHARRTDLSDDGLEDQYLGRSSQLVVVAPHEEERREDRSDRDQHERGDLEGFDDHACQYAAVRSRAPR